MSRLRMSSSIVAAGVVVLLAAGCTDTDGPLPPPQGQQETAVIAGVTASPEGDDLASGAGEYLVIKNSSEIPLDLGGWSVQAPGDAVLRLGIGRKIEVGAELRVYSSCGPEAEGVVHACLQKPALNDDGGELRLVDSAGTLVSAFRYK